MYDDHYKLVSLKRKGLVLNPQLIKMLQHGEKNSIWLFQMLSSMIILRVESDKVLSAIEWRSR